MLPQPNDGLGRNTYEPGRDVVRFVRLAVRHRIAHGPPGQAGEELSMMFVEIRKGRAGRVSGEQLRRGRRRDDDESRRDPPSKLVI